jgi:hypothetical protein
MRRHQHQHIQRALAAARQLGELTEELVFLGGSAVALLITDPAAPDVRPTLDIDAIVEVATWTDYYRLEERLRGKGFRQTMEENIICRWRHGEIVLDVMPTDERILGFSNRWYAESLRNAQEVTIEDVTLRLIHPPYFLGTKLEAFYGRGEGDYMASPDMEDIVTLLDGRPEIVEEVRGSGRQIKRYLMNQFKGLLDNNEFIESLPGHLPPDEGSQGRVPILLERMTQIAAVR